MWNISRPLSHRWDVLGVLSVLAPNKQRHSGEVTVRAVILFAAAFAVDVVVRQTGGLPNFYANVDYLLIIYASFALPFPLALAVTCFAIIGPTTGRPLFSDLIQDQSVGIITRPLGLGGLCLFGELIARAVRRNVVFYEDLYTAIATQFPNGTISLFDASLRYVLCGGQGITRLGLTPNQVVGKHPWEVADSPFGTSIVPAIQSALDGHEQTIELSIENRTHLFRTAPLRDADKKIVGALTLSQDITELRVAEGAVRESERRIASFLEGMPVGVFILDATGKAYYSNELATRLLGHGIVPGSDSTNLTEVYKAVRAGTCSRQTTLTWRGVTTRSRILRPTLKT